MSSLYPVNSALVLAVMSFKLDVTVQGNDIQVEMYSYTFIHLKEK